MTPLIAAAWLALLTTLAQAGTPPLVVGSKRFTESHVLGEIARQTLQQAGAAAMHKPGLGNTGILEQALASGTVDVDPVNAGTSGGSQGSPMQVGVLVSKGGLSQAGSGA